MDIKIWSKGERGKTEIVNYVSKISDEFCVIKSEEKDEFIGVSPSYAKRYAKKDADLILVGLIDNVGKAFILAKNEETSLYLAVICGSPGTGSKMMDRLLKLADEQHLNVSLSAMPTVLSYYIRPEFGFEFRKSCNEKEHIVNPSNIVGKKPPFSLKKIAKDPYYAPFLEELQAKGFGVVKKGECSKPSLSAEEIIKNHCEDDGYTMFRCKVPITTSEMEVPRRPHSPRPPSQVQPTVEPIKAVELTSKERAIREFEERKRVRLSEIREKQKPKVRKSPSKRTKLDKENIDDSKIKKKVSSKQGKRKLLQGGQEYKENCEFDFSNPKAFQECENRRKISYENRSPHVVEKEMKEYEQEQKKNVELYLAKEDEKRQKDRLHITNNRSIEQIEQEKQREQKEKERNEIRERFKVSSNASREEKIDMCVKMEFAYNFLEDKYKPKEIIESDNKWMKYFGISKGSEGVKLHGVLSPFQSLINSKLAANYRAQCEGKEFTKEQLFSGIPTWLKKGVVHTLNNTDFQKDPPKGKTFGTSDFQEIASMHGAEPADLSFLYNK